MLLKYLTYINLCFNFCVVFILRFLTIQFLILLAVIDFWCSNLIKLKCGLAEYEGGWKDETILQEIWDVAGATLWPSGRVWHYFINYLNIYIFFIYFFFYLIFLIFMIICYSLFNYSFIICPRLRKEIDLDVQILEIFFSFIND